MLHDSNKNVKRNESYSSAIFVVHAARSSSIRRHDGRNQTAAAGEADSLRSWLSGRRHLSSRSARLRHRLPFFALTTGRHRREQLVDFGGSTDPDSTKVLELAWWMQPCLWLSSAESSLSRPKIPNSQRRLDLDFSADVLLTESSRLAVVSLPRTASR